MVTYLAAGGWRVLADEEAKNYGFPKPDHQQTPIAAESMGLDFGVQLRWSGDGEAGVPDLFTRVVRSWSRLLQGAAS